MNHEGTYPNDQSCPPDVALHTPPSAADAAGGGAGTAQLCAGKERKEACAALLA